MAKTGPEPALVGTLRQAIGHALAAQERRPLVVGICGAQGSGKTTLSTALAQTLNAEGTASALLSLDDLYLTRAAREQLASTVHPLLATRGIPGTHDIALGAAIFDALAAGEPAALPRFDKAADDRLPPAQWRTAPSDCQVVLFEGWCVGAQPQAEEALAAPVNSLEATQDPTGIWRYYANRALAGPYAKLFGRIDMLILLAAPGFEIVPIWREQQEAELRLRAGPNASKVMSPREVTRFIQHYERLTRHILSEMPARAHIVVRLGSEREVLAIETRAARNTP